MKNPGEGSLNKTDASNKDGIVIAISVAAVVIVGALLAITARIRGGKIADKLHRGVSNVPR